MHMYYIPFFFLLPYIFWGCIILLTTTFTMLTTNSTTTVTSKYDYDPSLAAAVIAAALYGIAFLVNLAFTIKYKSWVWMVMVVAAGSTSNPRVVVPRTISSCTDLSDACMLISLLVEAFGYILRAMSIQNLENKSLYAAQFLLIILAPVLMAGVCYVLFVGH
jgi:hypothetical protein